MSIKQRLYLIAAVPFAFALLLSGVAGYEAWQKRSEAKIVVASSHTSQILSQLIHELQKERGMSAGFVSSKGKAFVNDLDKQRGYTEQRLREARSVIELLPDDLRKDVNERIQALESMRSSVSNLGTTVPELAGYYTGLINQLFVAVDFAFGELQKVDIASQSRAFIGVMAAKEKAGIERAMGATGFGSGEFNESVYRRFSSLGAGQVNLLEHAYDNASETTRPLIDDARASDQAGAVQDLREIVHGNRYGGTLEGISGPQWFGVSTNWIDTLKRVEDGLASDLRDQALREVDEANGQLFFRSAILFGILFVSIGVPLFVSRRLQGETSTILAEMSEIANGRSEGSISFAGRKDEIGQFAWMAEVFQTANKDRFKAEQAAESARQEHERAELQAAEDRRVAEEDKRLAAERQAEADARARQDAEQRAREVALLQEQDRARSEKLQNLMSDLAQALSRLANGDLTVRLKVNGDDEFGDMRTNFNSAVATLEKSEEDARHARAERELAEREAADERQAAAESKARADALLLEETERKRKGAEIQQAEARQRAERQKALISSLGTALGGVADGDMTAKMSSDHGDEFEQIRKDFNSAIGQLGRSLGEVSGSAHNIDNSVQGLLGEVNSLATRTETQAATLEETSASVNEITETVKQTSGHIKQTEKLVSTADDKAASGSEIMRLAMDAMKHIAESSSEVGQITSVMEEIAFQTNLLALNAGVEAARAGESGKGFAVVAQEVRTLAQNSGQAAQEIKNLIEKSREFVELGVTNVNDADNSLNDIRKCVSDVAGLISEISYAADGEVVTLTQINNAVSELDKLTQKNAIMIQNTVTATKAITSEVSSLNGQLERFSYDGKGNSQATISSARRVA